MPRFGSRSKERLATCDKRLQDVFNEVIKKDSVNKETEPILEKINNTGKLNYKCGGKVPHYDARKRRK